MVSFLMKYAVSLTVLSVPFSLFGASNTFISQGPGPSNNPFFGWGIDSGSPQPIATSPTDSKVIFLGGANGGVWRTKDFGKSWTPLTDHQSSLSIGSLAYDVGTPSNNTLVAGVGIASNGAVSFNLGGVASRGGARTGLLYTTDGGNTWAANLNGNGALVGKSVMNVISNGLKPNVSGRVLAATFEPQNVFGNTTGYGLFQSTDGGNTFNYISTTTALGANRPVTSLANKQNDPNTIYAAVADGTVKSNTALYKNTDGTGTLWTPVFTAANSGGLINSSHRTIIEAVTGPNNSVAVKVVDLDVVVGPNTFDQVVGVFLSQDGGGTWTALQMPATNVNPEGQGVVNSDIAIDPTNPNLVYLTGSFVNEAGFPLSAFVLSAANPAKSFADGTGGTHSHADSRFLAFDAAGRLLVGSDGGIDVRTNPSGTGAWSSVAGNLSLWQATASAYDANSNKILTAGQDTSITVQTFPNTAISGALGKSSTVGITGDGTNAAINDSGVTTSYFYSSTQNMGQLNRVTVVAGVPSTPVFLTGLPFGNNTVFEFTAPFVLNRNDPSRIAMRGINNVYTAQDTFLSASLGGINTYAVIGGFSSALAYGTNANVNAILVGSNSAQHLFFSSTAAVPAALPAYDTAGGKTPLSAVFDPRTETRFYVADDFNLWETTTTGTAFTSHTASLTALNITRPTAVEFLSNNGVNALFAGGLSTTGANSPVAVADSSGSGALTGWRVFGGSTVPNTMVNEIAYNNKSDTLLASAYGRGNWLMYDVTSNFPQATQLWFGKANNDSTPDLTVLTDGTTGGRPLIKFGPGTLTIPGPATYTGPTSVLGGIFSLVNANSSIKGDILVASGAKLAGIGTVGGTGTLNPGSFISPGNNGIGTLSFGGNYNQGPNSTYIDDVNRQGQTDLINIAGNANLSGGSVLVVGDDPVPSLLTYRILHANGGVAGIYDNVQTLGFVPGLLAAPILSYDTNNVYLNFKTFLEKIEGATSNQLCVAKQLDSIDVFTPDQSDLVSSVLAISTQGQRKALDLLSGAQYTNLLIEAEIANRNFIRRLYDPLRLLVTTEPNCDCSTPCCSDFDFWFEGGGTHTDFRHHGGFSLNGYEIAGGGQSTFKNEFTVGLAGGYASDEAHYRLHGSGTNKTVFGAVYGLYRPCNYYVLGDVAYGHSSDKVRRHIDYDIVHRVAKSSPKVNQTTFYGEAGIDFGLQSFLVQPFAGVEVDLVNRKKIKEHGAESADLFVSSKDVTKTFSRLGVHLTTVDCDWNLSLDLAWQCRFGNEGNDINRKFAQFGHSCEISGPHYSRNSFDYAAEVTRTFCANWSLYAEVNGQVWSNASTCTILGGVQKHW